MGVAGGNHIRQERLTESTVCKQSWMRWCLLVTGQRRELQVQRHYYKYLA